MASIKKIETNQRHNGRPVFHYRVRWQEPWLDDNGVPVRVNDKIKLRSCQETFPTFDAASERKTEIDGARRSRRTVVSRSAGDRLFGEVAKLWLDELQVAVLEGKLRRRTATEYENALRRYALPRFANRAVGAISRTAAKEFRAELVHKGLSRSSVNHAYDPLRWVLDLAVDEQALAENPATRSSRTKRRTRTNRPTPRGQVLAPEQVAAVANTVAQTYPVYGLLVKFAAYTGPRAGELAGLDVGDITTTKHPDGTYSGTVDIHEQRHKVRGQWVSEAPKSQRSTRVVPLPDWLAAKLHAYLNNTHPRGTDSTAPLFPNRVVGGARLRGRGGRTHVTDLSVNLDWSQPINPNAFYRTLLKPAFRANGIPVTDRKAGVLGVRFHDLRHTFATTALQAGVPYQRVSEWLGHSSYVITLTIYAHWIPKDDRAEINKLAEPVPAAQEPVTETAVVLPFRRRPAG